MSLWEQYPRSGPLITFPSSFGLPGYHRKLEIILHTESDTKTRHDAIILPCLLSKENDYSNT